MMSNITIHRYKDLTQQNIAPHDGLLFCCRMRYGMPTLHHTLMSGTKSSSLRSVIVLTNLCGWQVFMFASAYNNKLQAGMSCSVEGSFNT